MSYGKFHEDIYALIKKNGAMGVNALAKELDIPLSTMQKYMDKDQTYFKKNHSRKWELPEDSAMSDMSNVSGNYSNIIDSQLKSMDALIDTLMSQFRATVTLIETQKPLSHPVAAKSPAIDSNVEKMVKFITSFNKAIKTYLPNVPEEYQDLIKNLDISRMCVEMGMMYINSNANSDLTGLLVGNGDELTDTTLKIIERYQK